MNFNNEGEKYLDYHGKMTDMHCSSSENPAPLKKMNDFFTNRANGYDTHMLTKPIRSEQKLSTEDFLHYDIPCTIDNQIAMLKVAGFSIVEQVFRIENTTMLVARKEGLT